MTWLLTLTGMAQAAALPVVAPDASSLLMITRVSGEERAEVCADDGEGEDTRGGDGVWSCPVTTDLSPERIALLQDARSLSPTLSLSGELPDEGGLRITEAGQPELVSGALLVEGRPAGEPRGPRDVLILEVDLGPSTSAWMLGATGAEGRREVTCRDDGIFPDRAQNDTISSCALVLPSELTELSLRTPQEQLVSKLPPEEHPRLWILRWTREGVEPAERQLLQSSRPASEESPSSAASAPSESSGSRGQQASPQPPPGPEPQPPPIAQPGSGLSLWGVAFTLGLAGLAVWLLWRRPPEQLTHLRAAALPWERLTRLPAEESWSELLAERLRWGGVLVHRQQPLVREERLPGVLLISEAGDAVELLEAIEQLLRLDPLRHWSVLIAEGDLQHPQGLGIRPWEYILKGTPPRVSVVLLEHEPR